MTRRVRASTPSASKVLPRVDLINSPDDQIANVAGWSPSAVNRESTPVGPVFPMGRELPGGLTGLASGSGSTHAMVGLARGGAMRSALAKGDLGPQCLGSTTSRATRAGGAGSPRGDLGQSVVSSRDDGESESAAAVVATVDSPSRPTPRTKAGLSGMSTLTTWDRR